MPRKPVYEKEMIAASTRLPAEVHTLLVLLADVEDTSVSELIREAVEQKVKSLDTEQMIQRYRRKTDEKLKELAFADRAVASVKKMHA